MNGPGERVVKVKTACVICMYDKLQEAVLHLFTSQSQLLF